ncbi:hypothetical protein ACFL20_11785 [Spirochaetota bacterium]
MENVNKNIPQDVSLKDFLEPVVYKDIEKIVFRGSHIDGAFILGFLPGSEFIYKFSGNPDAVFRRLPVKRIAYEPYRTIIGLKEKVNVKISWPGKHDKLYVEGK